MAKTRKDITDTLGFALDVLALIPQRTYKTAKQIHQELEARSIVRDIRSVQRMLHDLADHYPQLEVYSQRRPYGYRWGANAPKLMLPSMNSTEALVLVMSQNYLNHFVPQDLNEALQSYFVEANAVLNASTTNQSAKDWLDKVRISPPTQRLIPPKINPEIFESVTHCLFNNLEIEVQYRTPVGKASEQIVHPYGLIDRAPILYLVAHKPDANDNSLNLRTYAMHRMENTRESSVRFERSVDFDLDEYVAEQRHMFGSGERIRIQFEITRAAGNHLREALLSSDQAIEEVDEIWLRIGASVNRSLELDRWMKGFGNEIRDVEVELANGTLVAYSEDLQ